MTLWHPDTCGCQIEISDDQNSPDWGQPIKHIKICPIHSDRGEDHKAVLEENRRKNLSLDDAKKEHPDVNFMWSLDSNRAVVHAANPSNSLTGKEKNDLEVKLQAKYGTGKVLVK